MKLKVGGVVERRWSLARREAERILADGAWHEEQLLFAACERFIDPRLAARLWVRSYERTTRRWGSERESGSEAFRRCEARALAVGRRGVFAADLRAWAALGRIERQTWNGRRYARLKPPAAGVPDSGPILSSERGW